MQFVYLYHDLSTNPHWLVERPVGARIEIYLVPAGVYALDDSFPRFLAQEFERRMIEIGYLEAGQNTKEFRSTEKNLPLYHLAFFSRSKRGYDFWRKGTSYSTPQMSLDL